MDGIVSVEVVVNKIVEVNVCKVEVEAGGGFWLVLLNNCAKKSVPKNLDCGLFPLLSRRIGTRRGSISAKSTVE